ncbi:MAG: hypothetical protein ACREJC_20900 [Tepidisphaeraceae bacterium]
MTKMGIDERQLQDRTVQVPASNGWPMVAAFGLTLVFTGLVTHWLVSALGALCLMSGLFGWFREVLPLELHESIPLAPPAPGAIAPRPAVSRLEVGELGHRARLPLEIYPYSASIRGGLVGGVAMAVVAVLYGVIWHHSIWYPVNLLAATGSASISALSYQQLLAFNGTALALALMYHVIGSALIGLLYGIALPMFPRHPIILGGILAPIFWSGILHAGLSIINPALDARIDWRWFLASQFAFGLVAGFVVWHHGKVATVQFLPFAVRAGLESPGLMHEHEEKEQRP